MNKSTTITGYIYKIANLINGKCYCGLTSRSLADRWKQHIEQTRRKKVKGITAAIKAYGPDNFSIGIIDEAYSLKELIEKEQRAIELNESLAPNGYNLSPGGEFNQSPPISVNGIIFDSRTIAARHFGIPSDTLNTRLKRGWSPEQACGLVPPPFDPSIFFNGKKYDNKAALAKEYKIDAGILISRLLAGWSIEEALTKPVRKFHNIQINDTVFKSLKSAAEYLNLKYSMVISRLMRGWNIYQALELAELPNEKEISIFIKGKKYKSIFEAAKAYGISYKQFHCRLRKLKWSPEQAAELVPSPKKSISHSARRIIFRNKEYDSHKHLALSFNANYRLFQSRLQKGWSIDEALGIKNRKINWVRAHPIEVNNKYFDTLTEACKYYGVGLPTVSGRLNRNGWTIEEVFGLKPPPEIKREIKLTINGKLFKRTSDAARFYGKSPQIVIRRLDRGWRVEEALGLKERQPRKSPNSKSVIINGLKYESIKQASIEFRIPYQRVRDRIHRGWTIEKALELL